MSKKKPMGEIEPQKLSAGGKRDMSGFDQYYDEAVEPGKRERAYAWATAIGLQDVDGLKPSAHLYETARRHIEGEITQEEARRIVDEYYETKDGHDLPPDTQEADKVQNAAEMAVRICEKYGVKKVGLLAGLHRRDEKLDIGAVKLDIEDEKLDIDGISAPTKANIRKLYAQFGRVDYFKRSDALKVLSLTPTAVSNLLAKMHQVGIIDPIVGHGKGAWRFSRMIVQGV